MPPRNRIVTRSRGDVVRVTLEMLRVTRDRLLQESIRRRVSLSDLVAEALSQRTVDPIMPDARLDAALRAKARRTRAARSP